MGIYFSEVTLVYAIRTIINNITEYDGVRFSLPKNLAMSCSNCIALKVVYTVGKMTVYVHPIAVILRVFMTEARSMF